MLLLVVAGCASPAASTTTGSTTPSSTVSTSTTAAVTTVAPTADPDTGDLVGVEVVEATIDGRPMLLADASTPEGRRQGLRGVTDLGDLDGMLFSWGGETVSTSFTMAGTVIPLDIAFFDADGRFVDGFEMIPCEAEPCPSYVASGAYAFAVETPAGTQQTPGEGSELAFRS